MPILLPSFWLQMMSHVPVPWVLWPHCFTVGGYGGVTSTSMVQRCFGDRKGTIQFFGRLLNVVAAISVSGGACELLWKGFKASGTLI